MTTTKTAIELTYVKNDNKLLFANFEDKKLMDVSKVQNYIPLYNKFFSIKSTNYNNINLNHRFSIKSIDTKLGYNKFEGVLEDSLDPTNTTLKKEQIFFKYSPLLDPIKYLMGKYEHMEKTKELLNLPTLETSTIKTTKLTDTNNSAYVDSFFTYLTSKLLHQHDFIHGVDFYGSFLAIKHDYMCDIQDDIDYLYDSAFFNNQNEIRYTFENAALMDTCLNPQNNTRKDNGRKPLSIVDGDIVNLDDSIIEITDINDISQLDNVNHQNNTELLFDNTGNKKANLSLSSNSSSVSSCSSRSSITDDEDTEGSDGEEEEGSDGDEEEDSEGEEQDDTEDEGGSEGEEESEDGEESIFVKIKDFPVQIIGLECCENTLDSLIEKNDLNDAEWDSIVLQILMMLITFQKTFELTHNDLHTNNIMYNKTDKEFLYYKIHDKYYKVPTYGRLFKIIDFGRAIYKFKGQLICSDSFQCKEGDAATQYNFEPYYNDKKPRIEPNFSFDLCRLGCSIFDFIVGEDEEDIRIEKIKSPILRIIAEWCKDDKGRNILYKNNGDERYPDFKLYKMIARKVHNHVPLNVLHNSYFDKYLISNKKLIKMKEKENKVMNIDELPTYYL